MKYIKLKKDWAKNLSMSVNVSPIKTTREELEWSQWMHDVCLAQVVEKYRLSMYPPYTKSDSET